MAWVDYCVDACCLFGGYSGVKSLSSPAGKGFSMGAGWISDIACSVGGVLGLHWIINKFEPYME